ncbi:MAG: anaerobic ribonucleoside-triphosphate reductase activating protein [Bacillota bacterium]
MKKFEQYIQVGGFVRESVVDGPGIRQVLFVSGCRFGCKGCQNPELQDFDYGKKMTLEEVEGLFYFDGRINSVTFSGGEPMEQAGALAELAARLKQKGIKDIMVFSGYTLEEILSGHDRDKLSLLKQCDLLVDGRFDINKKSLNLPYRGSSNQRIIDLSSKWG